jgi:hypothetical protein
VERPGTDLAGLWPRAAALIARRALEETLDVLWRRRARGLERASARAQLACLPNFLRDDELAADVTFAWSALSDACHHHDYELTPTWAELEANIRAVERLIVRVGELTGPPDPATAGLQG